MARLLTSVISASHIYWPDQPHGQETSHRNVPASDTPVSGLPYLANTHVTGSQFCSVLPQTSPTGCSEISQDLPKSALRCVSREPRTVRLVPHVLNNVLKFLARHVDKISMLIIQVQLMPAQH